MRLLAVLVLSLAILSTGVLATVEEFNGELASGSSVAVDDLSLIITHNTRSDSIFIKAGDDYYQTVSEGHCDDIAHLEVCFDGTVVEEIDDDYITQLLIRVLKKEPDITITRTIESQEFFVGQEKIITLHLSNTGDPAINLTYIDDFPRNIEITEVDGMCSAIENTISWFGHMDNGDTVDCTYTIRVKEELHRGFRASVRFFDGYDIEVEYSTELKLDVDPLLNLKTRVIGEEEEFEGNEFSFEVEDDEIAIGEKGRIVLRINNEFGDNVYVDGLTIILPPGVRYISPGSIRLALTNGSSRVISSTSLVALDQQTIFWSGKLNETGSKIFVIKVQADRSGSPDMRVISDYHADGNTFHDEQNVLLRIINPAVKVRVWLEDEAQFKRAWLELEHDDEKDIESMNEYELRVSVQNLDPYASLTNLMVTPKTDMITLSPVKIPFLGELGKVYTHKVAFLAPHVDRDTTFPFDVTVRYTGQGGQIFSNTTKIEFKVLAFQELNVNHDFEDSSLEGGEDTLVTVTVENERLIDIFRLEVKEVIPEEFKVQGVTSNMLVLKQGTEIEVYQYRLTAPFVTEKTVFPIKTIVTYSNEDTGERIVEETIDDITIEPKEPEVKMDIDIYDPFDDITIGQSVKIDYDIRNDEEEMVIRDITINFPLQQETDIVGPMTYNIVKLDPEESIDITNIIQIRPKVNGSIDIKPAEIEFYDRYGNWFNVSSDEEEIEVSYAGLFGPAIIAEKIVPEEVNETQDFTVVIRLRNIGSENTFATVKDGDRIWEVEVPYGQTVTLDYINSYFLQGTQSVEPAIVSYSSQTTEYHTASNGANINVMAYAPLYAEIVEEVGAAPVADTELDAPVDALVFEEVEDTPEPRGRGSWIIIGVVVVLVAVGIALQFTKKRPEHPFLEK